MTHLEPLRFGLREELQSFGAAIDDDLFATEGSRRRRCVDF